MKTIHLLKLAKISSNLEKNGFVKESDMIFNSLVRFANWQAPYMNEPMEHRMIDYNTKLEEELNDADEERSNFRRYKEQENIIPNGEFSDENKDPSTTSIEAQMHGDESNPNGGIKNVWYDGPSSTEKGANDWGRTEEEREQNNAAGKKYINLVPNFS
jgi:hypothetical protein